MFMKIANARKNRNKGFSLIELIIVIAIMVALVAVMAPQFIKYVQKSRNAALKTAAEDYLSSVKAAFIDEDTDDDYKVEGTITFSVSSGKLYIDRGAFSADAINFFNSAAGIDGSNMPKMGAATETYEIQVAKNGSEWTFKLDSAAE